MGGLSVGLNLVLKRIGQAPFWRRGSIRKSEIDAVATTLVGEFDVRTPSTETAWRRSPAATCKGGPGAGALIRS